ncbi:lipocalin family protein [Ideonella sp. BN130291]|uniref:lipocalin family protein n=1 Tax=Ideonella sp. BN130291 TaxID=3112940 RepID=UPI002E273FB6|nr:lipocalin family protein [Ideonella sp. BN130291]
MNAAPWITAAALLLTCASQAAAPVTPVRSMDPQRLAGTWYEVARLPDLRQATCASDVTAHFELRQGDRLKVTQTCRTPTGRLETDVGLARPDTQDVRHAARWKVSFLPRWLQWLPVGQGDLWVVMLDPAYRFAVISEPTRQHLWVMSRSPKLPAEDLGRIVDRLTADGYPTRQLTLTRQSAVVREIGPDQAVPFTGRPRLIVRQAAARNAA